MIIIGVWTYIAQSPQQFHRLSTLVKVTMGLGLGILPIYYLIAF